MDDTISRLAVIQIIEKMRARIGHNLERSVGRAMIEILDEVGEDVGKLPPVLSTNLAEVGTDAVSRKAVKELAYSQIRSMYCGVALKEQRETMLRIADNVIGLLAPVTSAQPATSCSEIPNNSDTISRQAAIVALDERIRQCDKALSSFDISMRDEFAVKVERASLVAFRETLEYLPSAEPEIIRCRDCKYNATSKKCLNPNSFFLVPTDDDFCSYAERREVQDENDKTTNNTTNA